MALGQVTEWQSALRSEVAHKNLERATAIVEQQLSISPNDLDLWIFELFAPVVEAIGYATIFLALVLGVLSREFFLQILVFGYAFATLISIGAVVEEEVPRCT
jgi:hypothetical protein